MREAVSTSISSVPNLPPQSAHFLDADAHPNWALGGRHSRQRREVAVGTGHFIINPQGRDSGLPLTVLS